MVSNLTFRTRLTAGLALSVALAGCSSLHGARHPAAAAPAESAPAGPQAPAAEGSQTATQAAVAAADTQPQAQAQPAEAPQVRPSAPMTYTVKRGDTLWGIASMFLRDPWLWPEIWYDNPRIHNPHLIYPGDMLVLAYGANGRPRIFVAHGGTARAEAEDGTVRLEPHLRSTALQSAIPAIPYSAVAAFLSRPAILTKREIDSAPHVVAFRNMHQAAGAGYYAYIRGLDAPVGARFVVLHIGEQLTDPESGRFLGYQGLYTATAQVVSAEQPEKVLLTNSGRETLRGDCLFPESGGGDLNFTPRAPSTAVRGEIISVIDDVNAIGQYDIVAINRGTQRGVTPGTVLAVDRAGQTVVDRGPAAYARWDRSSWFSHHVTLPEDRAGTLLVFKSYEHMSYALVVGASQQMMVGDVIRNP